MRAPWDQMGEDIVLDSGEEALTRYGVTIDTERYHA